MALLRTVLSEELVTLRAPEHAFFGERPCVVWALYETYIRYYVCVRLLSPVQPCNRLRGYTPLEPLYLSTR